MINAKLSTIAAPVGLAISATLSLWGVSDSAYASRCDYAQQTAIAYTSEAATDQLIVRVSGDTCELADIEILVANQQNTVLYQYSSSLREQLPFALEGEELVAFVPVYVERLLSESSRRSTQDLLPYSNPEDFYAASNDFVVIDPGSYEALRHQQRNVVWHTTGDSSWVNLVYDGTSGKSRVIMRGGVFNK